MKCMSFICPRVTTIVVPTLRRAGDGAMQINEPKWDAWKVLPEAVRTGQVAFALAHDGLDMHEVMLSNV